MLGLSRELNPECEHIASDMRTLRLDRTFDAVLVHDAVMYMTTGEQLLAAARTAFVHTRPGVEGLFSRATWFRILAAAGYRVETMERPVADGAVDEIFVCRRP
jgi:hypothetical protein